MAEALLEIHDLNTSFFTHLGEVKAVSDVSFDVRSGEVVAVVGESGSGKSVTALSIMNLISEPGRIVSGSIRLDGDELVHKSEQEMQRIRGKSIGMIFQDPMTSLNPVLTIGVQLVEMLRWHQKMSKSEARQRAAEMLGLVGLPHPEQRLKQYPHEFSGGMRQRVMIAMALICNPRLLIADEPTTALDVTIQAQIMDLLKDLKDRLGTSIILITHDLGVVAGMADRVIVMYAGRIVETGSVREIFYAPKHPYTWGLLRAVPRLDLDRKRTLYPIHGQPPDLMMDQRGCGFYDRCDYALEVCNEEKPEFFHLEEGHRVRCWLLHPQAPKVERKEWADQ
ncbi:MAG: ABC transporter ATP-binding protein [Bacillota bacterium]|nr:ABC transporter ATP-binding protein [Bacillota bacterium]HHT91770.1 ABC transporter ATP-binding protein [Bacillota bacterium]